MKILAIAPSRISTEKQLKYWDSLKGKPAWNKGLKRWWKSSTEIKKGQHLSKDTEIKRGQRLSPKTEFKKGNISWSKTNADKMPQGDKHHFWKGQNAGYVSLHKWVAKKLGKPSKCAFCKVTTAKRFEWANRSRKYKRDLKDWIRLCKSCHEKYDKKGVVSAI